MLHRDLLNTMIMQRNKLVILFIFLIELKD